MDEKQCNRAEIGMFEIASAVPSGARRRGASKKPAAPADFRGDREGLASRAIAAHAV